MAEAVAALRRRGVIGFPTETFYGLGADALDEEAVERVFALKGRDPNNPLPVIIADEEMLQSIVVAISPLARRLMERFWPGPLTLVLPGHARLPKPLVNRNGGVGVRISSHPLAQRLVKELGRPITATSANPSGQPPARSRAEVVGYFGSRVGIVIDGGKLTAEKGSTVVEVFAQGIRVIREGEIAAETLAQAARLDS
ncbi:MAG TPA: L-threonylcarbamoyladenylate synthase [Candidatus Acidoferrales bacterium]|nr:L-threonylcarbamoyladenylate synthase [Candidatus Acidoferrales bacterium]